MISWFKLGDWVMTVANVMVVTVTPLLLAGFTSLPIWVCFVIGVPGGFGVFWLLMFLLWRRRSRPPARDYALTLSGTIHSRPEFARISMATFLEDGSIKIGGRVSSRSDLESLRQLVASTRPPVTVSFFVAISEEQIRR
jgi:hypothetical protein